MANTVWQAGGVVAALGAGVFLVDQALLRMERRGWIYWRKRKGLSSIGADFMQEVAPGAQATKRAMEQERVRKNVKPAEEPPSGSTWTRESSASAAPAPTHEPEGHGAAVRRGPLVWSVALHTAQLVGCRGQFRRGQSLA